MDFRDLFYSLKKNVYKYIDSNEKKNVLQRRFILLVLDTIFITCSVLISLKLTNHYTNNINSFNTSWIYYYTIFIGLSTYISTGQYKGLMRYFGINIVYAILTRNIFIFLIISIISAIDNSKNLPINYILLNFIILTNILLVSRLVIREIFKDFQIIPSKEIKNVVIYGAGKSGAKLASSLNGEFKYKVLFFVDDSIGLWGRSIYGINIFSPKILLKRNDIDQILLAIPNLKKNDRKNIVKKIQKPNIEILEIPNTVNQLSKKININTLKALEIEDLLGREVVPPVKEIINQSVFNLNVCITGAGGSIGKQLSEEIIKLNPKKIILIENNEYSLYQITSKLNISQNNNIEIIPILGSVADPIFIKNIFKDYKIEILFHAAAFKHVPLVESCPIEGIKNNVLSTYYLCKEAKKCNLKKIILISTDKAVRPANIMGASKRLSELIFQSFLSSNNQTIFSIVRFGNVLGSSGSVVPLFKKQIENREAITLTHPEVIRYFMTISEAAQLVLQASVLAQGGDVFLLDMGEPVQIKDLAEQMISLSGLKLKTKDNPDGDIEIKVTGLRPGEKLYEELLIDEGNSQPTKHPLIFKANEKMINQEVLFPMIEDLICDLKAYKKRAVLKTLKKIIPEWS